MKPQLFIGRNISSETNTWLVSETVSFEEYGLKQIVLDEPDYSLFPAIKMQFTWHN